MIEILRWLGILIVAALRERGDLALENLALRQQLGVLRRKKAVPRLRRKDRVFWVVLSGIWPHWRKACTWSRLTRWSDGSERLQDLLGQDFAAEECRQTGSERGS